MGPIQSGSEILTCGGGWFGPKDVTGEPARQHMHEEVRRMGFCLAWFALVLYRNMVKFGKPCHTVYQENIPNAEEYSS